MARTASGYTGPATARQRKELGGKQWPDVDAAWCADMDAEPFRADITVDRLVCESVLSAAYDAASDAGGDVWF